MNNIETKIKASLFDLSCKANIVFNTNAEFSCFNFDGKLSIRYYNTEIYGYEELEVIYDKEKIIEVNYNLFYYKPLSKRQIRKVAEENLGYKMIQEILEFNKIAYKSYSYDMDKKAEESQLFCDVIYDTKYLDIN